MAEKIGSIYADAELKTAKYEQSLKKAEQDTSKTADKMGSSFGKIAKSVGIVVGALMALRGAYRVLKDITEAARRQERAFRLLEGQIKATGNAAGFTAQQLERMAGELQKVSNFGDEQIMEEAMSSMLKFQNVTGETFKRAIQGAVDMATVTGSLSGAAEYLGRALEDPLQGMTMLRRQGIIFNETQREMIKGFIEAGDVASAQVVILEQVEGTYKGMAKAMIEPTIQLKNLFGDLKEEIGFGMVTATNKVAAAMIPFLSDAVDYLGALRRATQGLGLDLENLTFEQLRGEIDGVLEQIKTLEETGSTIKVLTAAWNVFLETLKKIGQAIIEVFIMIPIAAFKGLNQITKVFFPELAKAADEAFNQVIESLSGTSGAISKLNIDLSELEAAMVRAGQKAAETPPGGDPDDIIATATNIELLTEKFIALGMSQEVATEMAKLHLEQLQELATVGHEAGQAIHYAFMEAGESGEELLDIIGDYVPFMEAFGEAAKDELKEVDELTKRLADRFSAGLADAIVGAIEGSKNFGDAFMAMSRQILSQIARMIVQMLILSALFPGAGLGLGALFGGNKGGEVGQGLNEGGTVGTGIRDKYQPIKANRGRIIHGSYADRDSVLTHLTKGEHVMNRAASMVNRPLFEELNNNPFALRNNIVSSRTSSGMDVSLAFDKLVDVMSGKEFSPTIIVRNEISAKDVNRANRIGEQLRGGF